MADIRGAGEDAPLLTDSDVQSNQDDHFVCNIEGPIVKDFDGSFQQQLRELLSLLIYYAQFAFLLTAVVSLFSAGSWQWATAALVLMVSHHVALAMVLMVRNGWVSTAWNYCCGVFLFNPMEGFDFLEEGCVGIIVAGACWLMYLALALMGLGFLSYCLLCYLVTALVFSLLLMDLAMLAATLLRSSRLLQPSEVLYIEHYRTTRLLLLAALQSAPLLLLGTPALAAVAVGAAPAPLGAPVWLLAAIATAAVASVVDAVLLARAACRLSGSTLPLYLAFVLQLRGAVKIPASLMSGVIRDMVRADGTLRVANAELDSDSWADVGCQMVPGYLLPDDSDRLESLQLVAAVREACSAVAAACGAADSCNRVTLPRLILEADLGCQHSSAVLLLGLRALRGLESVWVLGGRLGGPRFVEVGQEMAAHFFLSELRLGDVTLDPTALHILTQLLAHSSPLVHLEIVRSVLPLGPAAAGKVAPARAGSEQLPEQLQAGFFAALGGNSSLRYLSMAGTPLEAPAVLALCKVLQTNTTLTHLDLSFCSLRLEGAQALASALNYCTPTLHHLALAPSDITPQGTAALVRTAQSRLPLPPAAPAAPIPPPPPPPPRGAAPPPPAPLSLQCHDISEAVVPVGGLPGVTFVCLQDYNTLTNATWVNRVPAPPRGHLALFLLCHDDAVSTLVQAPLLLPGLASLDLSGVPLTEAHLALLTSALQVCPSIQDVDLSHTGLEDSGVQLLAGALLATPPLRRLALNGVAIGEIGGLALAQAVRECPNLHTLQLLHNLHPLPREILNQLQAAAQASPPLTITVIEAGGWGEIPASARSQALSSAWLTPLGIVNSSSVTAAIAAIAATAATAATTTPDAPSTDGGGLAGGAGAGTGSTDGTAGTDDHARIMGDAASEAGSAYGEDSADGAARASGAGSSGKSECGICCDSTDTIAIQNCQHHICATCYRHIQQTSGTRHPFSCPYCRAPIRGYRYLHVPRLLELPPHPPRTPTPVTFHPDSLSLEATTLAPSPMAPIQTR